MKTATPVSVFALITSILVSAECRAAEVSFWDLDPLIQNPRQLTFAGKRAGEGYFSADGSKLIFQSERDPGNPFFQIYLMDLETGDTNRISPGYGKTTCSWVHPSGTKVLYASTQDDPDAKAKQAAEIKDRESATTRKYSWDYDETYDIFESDLEGKHQKNLTKARGYNAEGSYSPDGNWIAFASNRHAYTGELSKKDQARFKLNQSYLMDIYIMRSDGSEVKRLTEADGYDGGPFFSADGKKICWRRFNVKGDKAEIWTMNIDGSGKRQLTRLGAMSWAPYLHPSGEYLIFNTNLHGFANFELYLVDAEGRKEPVRVTDSEGFDGLASFSPDGKRITWTSNKTSNKTSQIFLAKWNHAAAMKLLGLAGGGGVADAAVEVPNLKTKSASINADDLRMHVEYLASDALEGRLTGTPGEIAATQYVANQFRACGLEPGGDKGGYFQNFDFTAGVDLGEENRLLLTAGGKESSFGVNKDWRPLSFSTIGEFSASEVVFAGYGMDVPEERNEKGEKLEMYTSYVHLDVKDKWVLMFRYLPESIPDKVRQRYAQFSSLRYKALIARQKGAKGLLVVSGPNSKVKSQLVPLTFDASMAGSGIAALSVSDALAQKLLDTAGKNLKALQDKLDTGEMMPGITLKGVEISANVAIKEERRVGRNVLAVLPATDNTTGNPPIIFGAHVDHLGNKAGSGSLARSGEEDMIHNGADDNASGVAGILEAAEFLADSVKTGKLKTKRDIIFAAWSGEELGLLGSAHYVRDLARNGGDEDAKLTKSLAACLNMDMIGRLDKSLVLQGIGSSDFWTSEIERRNVVVGLPLVIQSDTFIPTDATSFYVRGVPILSAFTGAHKDYHTPRDTADKVNYDGAKESTRLMTLIARSLATTDDEPNYLEAKRPDEKGNRGKLRVYLGTIPDYSQGDISGVKLSGVGKGGPAEKAGVEAGDVVIELGGKTLKNIYDYTFVMGALKVDQETSMVVLRKGKKVKLKITPGSRE